MQSPSQLDYRGKVVLVTGGTKGIGAGIASAYLAAGAQVFVCGRQEPEHLPEADGRQAQFLAADVRDVEATAAVFERIGELAGRLDVLVNNAGGSPYAEAATASPRFSESILRLNLLAPLNIAQQANQLMQQQAEGGVIIFIGSVSASRPSPGTAVYGAAKAGIVALASSLAVEWGPKVRVLTISPGLIRTEQSHLHYGDEAGIAAVGAGIPAGRMGEPEDIANACLYAGSPMAAYFSGTNLLLHGGGERPAFLAASNAGKA
ncbi:short chain dehydrogenase/reductase family oxidoreductase [Pseudomonas saudimassiliensis]|uniref:Short chain dehydrogenase/reductase family oxidoreductase n=1 Tax=Pseudomonas saudimassiliensis TaxID=1461581 RepID=A0A078M4U5_9PSED|nr:SDR family oxidoreductase [Pseudomonas saudimassiliensis]CEA02503.1 short chain dehydrogenase/reductase family oxidoreductase [Pseudomonas saudimassiliensis]CEF25855.1 short chain dehydrogenase/reductase family oxidoreductase [Pseudomonas saudimassiliensis]